jgi:Fn3 associated
MAPGGGCVAPNIPSTFISRFGTIGHMGMIIRCNHRNPRILTYISCLTVTCLLIFTILTPVVGGQPPREAPLGVAWQVRGGWQIAGKGAPVLTGDAIPPGSLLQPTGEPANHSIMIFLPDGQRILYECFLAQDCGRAFRVPSLYRKPDSFAVDMLARIRTVLSRRRPGPGSGEHQAKQLPRDEALAVLGPGNRVEITGLAGNLPNGRYTYDLRPFDPSYPRQVHVILEKNSPNIGLSLPSSGLYSLTISDQLNTPRIDVLIGAVEPAGSAKVLKSFHDAASLIGDWNIDYQGWPIHDFQRAYLESLVLGIKPSQSGMHTELTAGRARSAGITAEPAFLPKPGLFEGDTAVTLRCETPGATMHYTVDGSQPFDNSPVYHAPIMVKGTELTIKAFAVAPGSKESAVVTGIFRIQE